MAIKRKEPDYGGWIRPFMDRESAIAALNAFIPANNQIDRGGMYLLEIINQLIQNGKEIFERIPSEIFSGCPEGGRKHVEASALCRAGYEPVPAAPDEPLESGYTRAQEIIGQWAEKDGCWSDTPETDQRARGRRHDDRIDGSEAHVYFDDPARHVYKTIDFSHYPSFETFLDRISIHNALFPEMAMHLEGFGMREGIDDNRGFVAIVRQPFAIGRKPSSDEEMDLVRVKLEEKGIRMPETAAGWFFVSESGNILIADVHDDNCVFDSEGNLLVFDCEAFLNINPALGGKYTVPPLAYNQKSVDEIVETIHSIQPVVADRNYIDFLLGCCDENEKQKAIESLNRHGTTVEPLITKSGEGYLIQTLPQEEKKYLLASVNTVKMMLQHHNGVLDSGATLSKSDLDALMRGEAVQTGDETYQFNLDKGRIDNRFSGRKLRLTQKLGRELDRDSIRKNRSIKL